jgi:hypothetical protein
MNSKPVYIVDEMAAIVAAVDAVTFPTLQKHINYIYGHPLEIQNRLQLLTNSPDVNDRKKKFPLIALFEDIPIRRGVEEGVYGTAIMTIIIANITEPDFTSEERETNNFKPILIPIYLEFLNQLVSPVVKNADGNKLLFVDNADRIKHTQINHKYWGRQGTEGNVKSIFNDYIDCIEIQNLEVSFYNNYY